jgi:hypothetical protein
MDNKEIIDSLKFMSQTHRGQLNERRRHELRVFFTALTFYVLAGAMRFSEHFPEKLSCLFKVVIWLGFLLLAVVSSAFLWFIHNASYSNKTIAERAEDAIGSFAKGEETKIDLFAKPFLGRTKFKWANWVWQLVAIALFAGGSAIILTLI